jgi:hypothetical protein
MPPKVDIERKKLKPLDSETVTCEDCGHFVTELVLTPGTIIRTRCHCKTRIRVYVVGVPMEAR